MAYVAHQRVSSPDGHLLMVHGGAKHDWTEGPDVTYSAAASSADEGFLALLGITRLASIAVRGKGLDVYWVPPVWCESGASEIRGRRGRVVECALQTLPHISRTGSARTPS